MPAPAPTIAATASATSGHSATNRNTTATSISPNARGDAARASWCGSNASCIPAFRQSGILRSTSSHHRVPPCCPATTRGMPARSRTATTARKPRRAKLVAARRPIGRSPCSTTSHPPSTRRSRAPLDDDAQRGELPSAPGDSADRLEAQVALREVRIVAADVRRIARDEVPSAGRHAGIPIRCDEFDIARWQAAARCRAQPRARRASHRCRPPRRCATSCASARAMAPEPVPRSSTRTARSLRQRARVRIRPAFRFPGAGSGPPASPRERDPRIRGCR